MEVQTVGRSVSLSVQANQETCFSVSVRQHGKCGRSAVRDIQLLLLRRKLRFCSSRIGESASANRNFNIDITTAIYCVTVLKG